MKTFERLNKNEMKMIVGGNIPGDQLEGGGCKIRCNQDTDVETDITDCLRATAEATCTNTSNALCYC